MPGGWWTNFGPLGDATARLRQGAAATDSRQCLSGYRSAMDWGSILASAVAGLGGGVPRSRLMSVSLIRWLS